MIALSDEIIHCIKEQGEKFYPDECCGFILGRISGRTKYAELIQPAQNTAGSESFHRFVITPEEMMRAEFFAVKNGLDIVGFYHSHPDCKAYPSEYDRTHALPVYSYVITSVKKGTAEEIFSYRLDENNDYRTFIKENINVNTKE